jgi:glycogen debranching enzyme
MGMERDHLIRLRPRDDTLYVSQNRTVLATERDGFIYGGRAHGLLVYQTRLLSKYRYLIDGKPPYPVASSNIDQHTWLGYYIMLPPAVDGGERDQGSGQLEASTQQSLELRLSRYVGDIIHEDVDLTNFTQYSTSFTLTLEVEADFADVQETGRERKQKGKITEDWRKVDSKWELFYDYKVEHKYDHQGEKGRAQLHRGVTISIDSSLRPSFKNGRISFQINLEAQGTWHACIEITPLIDEERLDTSYKCNSFAGGPNERDRLRQIVLDESTEFTAPLEETLTHTVMGALSRARQDLLALRLYDLDHGDRAWTMAAGLPIYIALFGRDTLTAAWQAAILGPEMMRGTLEELPRWQGTESNPWRDEQPGRHLHEAHTGPLEMLNFNPRERYYGSVTTSGFYPVVVAELWHWTGDREIVEPFIEPALKGLQWLDKYSDADGDGFYEYLSRSELGVTNQAWKDSGDAIVYEDGSQVEAPIATCEEQGFVYLAKLFMSEVCWWFDRKDEARRLYREATELKKRFNEAFWVESESYIAMGLDSQNRQITSIGSNAGHCLATGIVDEALVAPTVGRFIADDLFSGWGIRTLSSRNPAYNPYSYHRGSVWPVEHGTFALGFMRYGLPKHIHLIAKAQFEAASLFDHYRLPELFSGHQRDEAHPFPALYPNANTPQAWSASAVFCMVQAMLGLYPYAPLNILLVDPHLPEWLPEITLTNLRVGDAAVTIRFYRESNGESGYRVFDMRGSLHVIRQPSPWSLTATFPERLKDLLTSFLPVK